MPQEAFDRAKEERRRMERQKRLEEEQDRQFQEYLRKKI